MKNIIFLIIILLLNFKSFPQQQSNWQNYTSMKSTKDIAVSSDGVWAASVGGAYFYKTIDQDFNTFSKSNGLIGTSLTATRIDNYNKVWFGSESGIIDVYNLQTNSFHSILDIYNSDKTTKSINDITVYGDTVYVATDFGVSLIDSKSYFFYDTFSKFGSFTSNTQVNSVLVSDLIYVATAAGVAIQKAGATNLSAPESWNVYTTINGLPSNVINDLEFYNGSLFAATKLGLSKFNGTLWQTFISLPNIEVLDILTIQNSLYILTANNVYLYDGNTLTEIWSTNSSPTKLAYQQGVGLVVATKQGIYLNNNFIYPNGPEANQFPNMIVDGAGNFWSASGTDVSGVGLYKYNGSQWETYNVANYPDLYTNTFYEVFASSDNTIYGGSWGQGFVRIKGDKIERFHAGNTDLVGVTGNLNFVVISGFAEDSKKNMWILNLNAADKNTLAMLTPDSLWYFFKIPVEQFSEFTRHFNLVIDPNGTKWFNIIEAGSIGLFYFNDKGTYQNAADDVYGYITTTSGLKSNDIYDIKVDKRGDLWVGTNIGLNIITNLSSITSSSTPQLKITSAFSVRQQTINALAVDPINQKWVGTNQGLFLLNSDGTQLLATLDSKNSPLLSDKIVSLAIDEKNGRVYVGSDEGLTSFDTPSILPAESFNGLNIYPSPFIVKDGSQLITIDGLIKESDIKITSISGKLVREFSSPGGRVAFWDGRDDNGNLVGSGIYIVIAFDKEGNSAETGKIALLRE